MIAATQTSTRDRILSLLGDFREGEFKQAFTLQLQFSVIIFVLLLGRTVRDALFLSRNGVEDLPLMYACVGVVTTAATLLYTRVIGQYSLTRVAPVLQLFLAISFGLFAALSRDAGSLFYSLLYLWVEVLTAITVIQFWNITNGQFDPRQAKRLYGFIAAGQAAGNLLCGALASGAGTFYSVDDLLWVIAFGCFVVGLMYLREYPVTLTLKKNPRKPKEIKGKQSESTALGEFKPYVIIIVGLIAATYIGTSWVDFQFKVIAKRTLEEAALTRFFGQFYGAVGLVSFIVQLVLLRHVTRFLGLFGALSVMPVLFILIGSLLPIFPVLFVATALKFSENGLRYAIYDPLVQTIYLPLPASIRAKVQSLASGVVKPVGMGIAGLILLPLLPDQPDGMPVEWLGLFISVVSLLVVVLLVRLRRGYLSVLVKETAIVAEVRSKDPIYVDNLQAIDRLRSLVSEGGAATISWFMDRIALRDDDVEKEILLTASRRGDLPMTLRTRLASRFLELGGLADLLSSAEVEGADDDSMSLLRALASKEKFDNWRRLLPQLEEGSSDIRKATLLHLFSSGVPEAVLQGRDYLLIFAESDSISDRILSCEMAEFLLPEEQQRLVRLSFASNELSVQLAVLSFLARKPVLEFLPDVVLCLDNPELSGTAARALASAGASGFEALETQQEETDAGRFAWRRLGPLWSPYARDADLDWQEFAMTVIIVEPDPVYWLPSLLALDTEEFTRSGMAGILLDKIIATTAAWIGARKLLDNMDQDDNTVILLRRACTERYDAAIHAILAVLFKSGIGSIERWERLLRHGLYDDSGLRANLAEIIDQDVTLAQKQEIIDLLELQVDASDGPSVFRDCASPIPQIAATHWPHDVELSDGEMAELVDRVLLISRLLFLSSVPLFKSLRGEDLEQIAEVMEEIQYDPDHTFITQGDVGDSLYLITKGKVAIIVGGSKVAELEQGAVVGEIALLDDQPRTASVTTIGDVEVLRLDRSDFNQLLNSYPQIGRGVMKVLTERLRNVTDELQATRQSAN